MPQRLILPLISMLLPLSLLAGEANLIEKQLDALLVCGEEFVFSVKEPPGWIGDIEVTRKYLANISCYPAGKNNDTT